jgi:hypothetical protein
MNNIKNRILIAVLLLNIVNVSARQPLLEEDGLIIQHRGFNELVASAQSSMTSLNKTNEDIQTGMKDILQETRTTIAAIPKILTSAEFITRAGIKIVGISFCIGGAHWIWNGANDIMEGYSPIEKEGKLQARLLRKQNRARAARAASGEQRDNTPLLKENDEDEIYAQVRRIQSRQHYKRGAIKLFAGFFSLGVGCYAMFRTENIATLFGAPN